jgi:hypothetical protein
MSNLLSFCLHSLSYSRQSVVKEISLHFHRVVLVICLILLYSCIDICFYGKEDALSENELVHGKIQLQGSAHCTLGPYWASKLGKKELKAFQASERGAKILVQVDEDAGRVYLQGGAVLVMAGVLLNTMAS